MFSITEDAPRDARLLLDGLEEWDGAWCLVLDDRVMDTSLMWCPSSGEKGKGFVKASQKECIHEDRFITGRRSCA